MLVAGPADRPVYLRLAVSLELAGGGAQQRDAARLAMLERGTQATFRRGDLQLLDDLAASFQHHSHAAPIAHVQPDRHRSRFPAILAHGRSPFALG